MSQEHLDLRHYILELELYCLKKGRLIYRLSWLELIFFFFMLDENSEKEIVIHGLGAAINRAIKLALILETRCLGAVTLSPNTSTQTLIDEFLPLKDVIQNLEFENVI